MDRKVNFTVETTQVGLTQVNLNQQNAVTTFKVTNLTNGAQDFLLEPDQQSIALGIFRERPSRHGIVTRLRQLQRQRGVRPQRRYPDLYRRTRARCVGDGLHRRQRAQRPQCRHRL
ncbi:hypothetical protein AB5I41_25885 [Sphingomonas sp. MMS24-JH45]